MSVRVLSVDARTFGRDRAVLAKTIADAAVDVACVHGGPHLLRWRSICAALGRRAGLVVVTGGRTAGANLLLSSLGVDVSAVRDLTLGRGSLLVQPGAALAALGLRGIDFAIGSATLIGNSAERLAQSRGLQAALDSLVPGSPPAIISAEGTDRPGTAAWQALAANRVTVADRLFVDSRIAVDDVTQLSGGSPATRPVVVTLSLPS
jgi:hypothetical protein